jgi:GH43 family beta-xylosidase
MSAFSLLGQKSTWFRVSLALCGIVSSAVSPGCAPTDAPPPDAHEPEPNGRDGGLDAGVSRDGGHSDASLAGPKDGSLPGDSGVQNGGDGGASGDRDGDGDGDVNDAGTVACTTRITYGSAWIHGGTNDFDLVQGDVRWDGQCIDDGKNSYAVLSNGWKPYFEGHASCIIALDHSAGCSDVPKECSTRVSYGDTWNAPANHDALYDNVKGRVTWNGQCKPTGQESYATLSNGWVPHFKGTDGCRLSFTYNECGGLYQNAVVPAGCADPGVMRDGDTYYVACTSGNAGDSFGLWTSKDLVHYTWAGHAIPNANRPSWAKSDFWAPELHKVGDRYAVYYSARGADGKLAIGAGFADDPLGPYLPPTDGDGKAVDTPIIHDNDIGLIDVTTFVDTSGQRYLVWKVDGNAKGEHTPIYGQAVEDDAFTLKGPRATLITNDKTWEGGVVEGPWVVVHEGRYYLFYSGNAYYNETYAVGVARADSPLGPYEKRGDPILTTNERWIGPGHCSVVEGPSGVTQMVYHAWLTGKVGSGNSRVMLVDPVQWGSDWPTMPEAPSLRSVPLP